MPQFGLGEGDGIGQRLPVVSGQDAGPEPRCRDHRVEGVFPVGARGGARGGMVQDLARGVGVESGHVGDGVQQRSHVRAGGVQFQGGQARPGLEHGGRRIAMGEQRGGLAQGVVEVRPWEGCVYGVAVSAQEQADGDASDERRWRLGAV